MTSFLESLTLTALVGIFAIAALIIGFAGTKLAGLADEIADRTGWGEALTGALLLGATTSLAGTIVSITGAASGSAGLAIGNAIGGIAAQTAFLAIGDLVYRRVNLEHAAASLGNLMQGTILIMLLSLPILFWSTPPVTLWGVHPGSILLFAVYLAGLQTTQSAREAPMWQPEETRETVEDETPTGLDQLSATRLYGVFCLLVLTTGVTGYVLGRTALVLADRTGIDETAIGAIMTSVVTSLPELVTTIAAVRQGALTLAVSGIIGGNAFDVLFLSLSDLFYREGSIYHAMETKHLFLLAISIVMSAVLVLGLMRRERRGPLAIGFEGLATLGLYALTLGVLLRGAF